MRWPLGSGLNPQNVQYRAYDGTLALDNLVGYTVLYQGNAVNDFEADGVFWERLDTVVIRNGSLIVEMSDRGVSAVRYKLADRVVRKLFGKRAKPRFRTIERSDHLQQVAPLTWRRWPAEDMQTRRDQSLLDFKQLLV